MKKVWICLVSSFCIGLTGFTWAVPVQYSALEEALFSKCMETVGANACEVALDEGVLDQLAVIQAIREEQQDDISMHIVLLDMHGTLYPDFPTYYAATGGTAYCHVFFGFEGKSFSILTDRNGYGQPTSERRNWDFRTAISSLLNHLQIPH